MMTRISPPFRSPQGAQSTLASSDSVAGQSRSMSVQWAALHDAAAAVAAMAGLEEERASSPIRNFPAQIRDEGGWRLALAETGITDLSAIMRPGLTALLAVRARGQDASTAALALWQEFHAARDTLLGLAPESGAMGPRRSA